MTDAPTYYGIEHPLETQITTHLFVLCPNNSGSTFLKNALRSSAHTWNLSREGQRTFGFVGPRGRDSNRQLIWAGKPEWATEYADPANFDWEASKRAWYAQAVANDPGATVMVEKSPPFLLIPDQLCAAFRNARFVLMVRDPYATYEGIIRRRVPNPPNNDDDPRVLAAQHVMACFEQQRRNVDELADRSTFFTYEALCAEPARCAQQLAALVPELADVDLDRRVPVKGMYDERLRNMNDDQIANLADADREVATEVFAGHVDVVRSFGYELR